MFHSNLKGVFCLVLAAALLFSCCSCGKNNPAVPEQDTPQPYIPPYSSDTPDDSSEVTSSSDFCIRYHPDEALNPYMLETQTNRIVSGLVYEGLFSVTPNFESKMLLCSECHTDNGVTYNITIRRGVKFHDGEELTAEDVVYSIRLAMSNSLYSSRLSCIRSISHTDRYDLTITLSRANTLFPLLLDVPVIRSGEGDVPNPAGTGPYMLAFTYGKPLLKASPTWRNSPSLSLKTIGLVETSNDGLASAYETGEIDLVTTDPAGISYINYGGDNEIWYYDTASMQYIGFNTNHLFLGNDWARRAVSLAIDRDFIAENCMSDYASVSTLPVSPSSALWSSSIDEKNRFSLQAMSDILLENKTSDADGDGFFEYEVTGINVSFDIDFIVNSENTNRVNAARKITSTLRNAGFDITLRELSWEDYTSALSNGDFDMYYGEVLLTADFDLTELITPGGKLNYGKASVSKCSELIDKYLSASEPGRKSAAAELYKFLADYCPVAPVLFRREAVLTHRDVVSGALPTQYNVFNAIADWTIKTE